eukprot:376459-Hanusia_phi.AAC.1
MMMMMMVMRACSGVLDPLLSSIASFNDMNDFNAKMADVYLVRLSFISSFIFPPPPSPCHLSPSSPPPCLFFCLSPPLPPPLAPSPSSPYLSLILSVVSDWIRTRAEDWISASSRMDCEGRGGGDGAGSRGREKRRRRENVGKGGRSLRLEQEETSSVFSHPSD